MLTNLNNLSMSIAVWLADDDYDHNKDTNTLSATSLLKPTKSILLSSSIPTQAASVDVLDLVPSRMGTALHTAIEQAWLKTDLKDTLAKLNLPNKIRNNIVVNPNPEDLTEDSIPIYMEIRRERELLGFTITGKFDFICDGVLEDFKSTSTFNWINQSNKQKYIEQGSIYRWLNPDLITEDYMRIQYIFTDWSAVKAKSDPTYPKSRIVTEKYPLMTPGETEAFIANKLNELIRYKDIDQSAMPVCTAEEIWQRPAVYKYYKNPANKTRSTKNFDEYWQAYQRYVDDGSIGEIVTVEGSVGFCRYCPAVSICEQAHDYIRKGQLIL